MNAAECNINMIALLGCRQISYQEIRPPTHYLHLIYTVILMLVPQFNIKNTMSVLWLVPLLTTIFTSSCSDNPGVLQSDDPSIQEQINNGPNDQDDDSRTTWQYSDFTDFVDELRQGMIFIKDINNRPGSEVNTEYDVIGNISDTNNAIRQSYGDLKINGNTLQQDADNQWYEQISSTILYGNTKTVEIKNAANTKVEFSVEMYFPDELEVTYNYSDVKANNVITWNQDTDNDYGLLVVIAPKTDQFGVADDDFYIHIEDDDGSYTLSSSDLTDMPSDAEFCTMTIVRGDYAEDTDSNGDKCAFYIMNGVSMTYEVP